ncbi:MAG: hypothetical protein E7166_02970 [Firmicutes bacterium]|nr:hypothetical protein [Bacillota bacterium]
MEVLKKIKQINNDSKKVKLNLTQKLKVLFLIFVVGCIVGYVYEEIFHLVIENEIVNRGFLYGPYLPVYGVGAIFLTLLLRPLKKHPLIIFGLSMIITGIVEYITGYAMWEIWHRRWWDYTGLFLNVDGYICLRSLLTFAIATIFLLYVIEPYIVKYIKKISYKKTNIFIIMFSIIFIIDLFLTFLIRNKI